MPCAEDTLRHLFAHENTRKISVGIARTVSAERTLEAFRDIQKAIPITRLADLTPLDRIGTPVFCAVTPLARDLTTHMGKGRDPASARVSAFMEACERATAETLPERHITGSYDGLSAAGHAVADPRAFTLPGDSEYAPSQVMPWVPGVELNSARSALIAADLVMCPPQDRVLHQPDTNGLASGNTSLEAIVHALCELIERDAAGQLLFSDLYGDDGDDHPGISRLDESSGLPDNCLRMIEDIKHQGLSVLLEDITQGIAVPVCRATIVDPSFPTPNGPRSLRFRGLGCDPNAELAASRALTEACQSRLARIQGARDSFNKLPNPAKRRDGPKAPVIAWQDLPDFQSIDLLDDLAYILQALRRAGFETVYSCKLPCVDERVAVVRACIPGLSVFFVDQSRVCCRDLRWLI